MLTRLIESRISSEERWLGENLDYLKYILRTSMPAFFKYIRIVPAANFRRDLPPAPYHVAALLSSRHEGCGNCVQIEINMSKADGVSPETLAAVLANRPNDLDDGVRDAYLFTDALLNDGPDQERYRQRIVERFGDRGLVELCLKIAVSRVFPFMTRALGFASSCTTIEVDQSGSTRPSTRL